MENCHKGLKYGWQPKCPFCYDPSYYVPDISCPRIKCPLPECPFSMSLAKMSPTKISLFHFDSLFSGDICHITFVLDWDINVVFFTLIFCHLPRMDCLESWCTSPFLYLSSVICLLLRQNQFSLFFFLSAIRHLSFVIWFLLREDRQLYLRQRSIVRHSSSSFQTKKAFVLFLSFVTRHCYFHQNS